MIATALGLARRWPLADDPLAPSPDEARRWAQEELAKPAYGESFLERFVRWLADLADAFVRPTTAPGALPVPPVFVVVAVLALAGIVVLIVRAGKRKRTAADAEAPTVDAVFAERPLAAAEYRRRAAEALDAGDATGAVVDGFRAIAAQLLERHVLDEARDRTAREFAAAAGGAFPDLAPQLPPAADAFDAALYGALPATPDAARAMLTLEERLRQATPRPVDPAELPAPLAVPR